MVRPRRKRSFSGHRAPVFYAAYSADGRWLVSEERLLGLGMYGDLRMRERLIKVWDASSGEEVVHDYGAEAKTAPADWPFRSVVLATIRDSFRR
jgi:hypothetical protein